MPPTTVASATVKEVDWAPILSAVGSISPVQGAVVSAELGGTVSQILFQNGGTAKKGDVLMRLDASSETAQLKTAEADLALAKSDLDRARDLARRKVISQVGARLRRVEVQAEIRHGRQHAVVHREEGSARAI